MDIKKYLEMGAKKAGSLTALGKIFDISQPYISSVKAGRKTLPVDAAVKLADYIGEDVKKVIAANELITEKKEEKIRYWNLIMQGAQTKTASQTESRDDLVGRIGVEPMTNGLRVRCSTN